MMDPSDRLARLRAELTKEGLTGFVVPISDPHMSEYVNARARRLAWLTGFEGSAGTAVVLSDRAAMFVDGRYAVQVRQQVPDALYDFQQVPGDTIEDWLRAHAGEGARIGYDPWLHTRGFVRRAAPVLSAIGGELVAVGANPVDVVRGPLPAEAPVPAFPHPDVYAGVSFGEKLGRLRGKAEAAGADILLLSALDSVAWAFNMRGGDVPHTPVAEAFALIGEDGATLFLAPEKTTDALRRHLGEAVMLRPYADFPAALGALGGKRVLVDPETAVAAIFDRLEQAGAHIVEQREPVVLMKAVKNRVELAGARAAHLRDAFAMVQFLASFEAERPQDELEAAARLDAFRRRSPHFRDLSFPTISAFGPNAALPHYQATAATNLPIAGDGLYLVDSGGQYPDGTTDVTRTIAVGTPSAAMVRDFTLVLKGHIAVATARFPQGVRGSQLDAFARQYLWAAGRDFQHGTGHGVGAYLGVHEGPQRISPPTTTGGEPLRPGMILSNEPGYYEEGSHGIRIENLVIVRERPEEGDRLPMLGFETITLVPIDRRLIDVKLLTAKEVEWVDRYHEKVRAALVAQFAETDGSPAGDQFAEGSLAEDAPGWLRWLVAATAPLAVQGKSATQGEDITA